MILPIQTTVEINNLRITNMTDAQILTITIEFEPKYKDGVKNNTVTARNLVRQSPELRQVITQMIRPFVQEFIDKKEISNYAYNQNGITAGGKKVSFYLIFSCYEGRPSDIDKYIEDALLNVK